jgi:hypothetical protein
MNRKVKLSSSIGFVLLLLSACVKKEEEKLACVLSVRVLLLNFNVVDASTQQDLYFSANPRFSTKDIYFFKKADQSRRDTIRPNIVGVGNNRYFSIPLSYNPEETFILKTGNLTENNVAVRISKTENVCTDYQVEQVTFNGSLINAGNNGVYTLSK